MLVALAGFGEPIYYMCKPTDGVFVQDNTNMVSPGDKNRITEACARLLSDRGVPVVVLTIQSLSLDALHHDTIESFATNLFNQWGALYRTVHGAAWTRGILLVVSREDRRARIELGSEWDRSYDNACKSIMNEAIIPCFQRGDYSGGIAAGVAELDRMARGLRPPSTGWGWMPLYNPLEHPWVVVVLVVLAFVLRIWRAISYYSSYGYSGRGYYDDPYLYGRPGGWRGGSGGFSSGGGSSRGGGATGSW